jgi:hypothetical protein
MIIKIKNEVGFGILKNDFDLEIDMVLKASTKTKP